MILFRFYRMGVPIELINSDLKDRNISMGMGIFTFVASITDADSRHCERETIIENTLH